MLDFRAHLGHNPVIFRFQNHSGTIRFNFVHSALKDSMTKILLNFTLYKYATWHTWFVVCTENSNLNPDLGVPVSINSSNVEFRPLATDLTTFLVAGAPNSSEFSAN